MQEQNEDLSVKKLRAITEPELVDKIDENLASIHLKRCTKSPPNLRFYEETMCCRLDSPPYTIFLLNDDMKLNRNRQFLI